MQKYAYAFRASFAHARQVLFDQSAIHPEVDAFLFPKI